VQGDIDALDINKRNRKIFSMIKLLTPNGLYKRRAVSPLKIKSPVINLGMQRCAEGFNFGVKG
jgi:hypothetical protein